MNLDRIESLAKPVLLTAAALSTAAMLGVWTAPAAAADDYPTAASEAYPNLYQRRVGDLSNFYVEGPAAEVSGQSHDAQGDVFIRTVTMPNGKEFTKFYKPIAIHGLSVGQQDGMQISVNGGERITDGTAGKYFVGQEVDDGDDDEPTAADYAAFAPRVLEAMGNNNLNHYFDCSGRNPTFEFTLEFELPLKDNDPGPDDFGELLYFERGVGFGNSWITIQAVDEHGNALGPALAVSPFETVQTTPPTQVTSNSSQYIGAVSVDISRLGVSETRFLKVRKTDRSDDGYYRSGASGEDFNPDFKFMAVITHPEHLTTVSALYD